MLWTLFALSRAAIFMTTLESRNINYLGLGNNFWTLHYCFTEVQARGFFLADIPRQVTGLAGRRWWRWAKYARLEDKRRSHILTGSLTAEFSRPTHCIWLFDTEKNCMLHPSSPCGTRFFPTPDYFEFESRNGQVG
ncbi:hypothetical protein B0T24DRAFT_625481 [Lasiosphaeria ovina]|uniref:Secreted protein n=1 Tax=Lasiosphaeria ovina TaxID=92902 RepID=A0AAE0KCG9_9PEZI|nr:hypothetical protein B0T24DRAFT_625481 [Lasiosphaeria ovina]